MKKWTIAFLLLIVGCASRPPAETNSTNLGENSQQNMVPVDPERRPSAVTGEFPAFIRSYQAYSDEELAAAVAADGVKGLSCREQHPFTVTARQGSLEVKAALTYGQASKAHLKRMDLFVNGTLMCQFRPHARGLAGTPASDKVSSCQGDLKIELYETCCARGKSCTSLIE